MTLGTLLDQARSNAERPIEHVDAVYDDELWAILDHYGLLAPLDRGELVCYITGVALTRQNVGGLIGTPRGPQLIADTYHATGPGER